MPSRFLSRLLIIALIWTSAPVFAAPALWRIADEDTEIFLFGTLHIMSKDADWISDKLEASFNASSALIVELDGRELDRAGPLFAEEGKLPYGQQLRMVVGNGVYNDVVRLNRKLDIPENAFDSARPWFAGMSLAVIGLVKADYDPASGADKYLLAHAEASGKTVLGIETAAQQAALFGGLTPAQEKALLVDTLRQSVSLKTYFASMEAAWLAGDLSALDQILNASLATAPGLEDRLLLDRNKDWAQKIGLVMNKPGRFFMAVGVGHMVGDGSVIALLERAGHPVLRLE